MLSCFAISLPLLLALNLPVDCAISSSRSGHEFYCRTERGLYLPFESYKLDTCARCYNYVPNNAFTNKLTYILVENATFGILYDILADRSVLSNETFYLERTFRLTSFFQKWISCCQHAIYCCLNHLRVDHIPVESNRVEHCPKTWDGWSCWSDARVNSTSQQECPDHVYYVDWEYFIAPPCRDYAFKRCESTGSWYKKNDVNREWTNYSSCAGSGRTENELAPNYYCMITYLISVAFIVPALGVFIYYRQLSHTNRVRIHMHLLTSILCYSILRILVEIEIVRRMGPAIMESGDISAASSLSSMPMVDRSKKSFHIETIYCLFLSVLVRYFRSTNYFWMFNEAFYLYQLMYKVFTTPSLRLLVLFAYGVPLLTNTSYILVRTFACKSAEFSGQLTTKELLTLTHLEASNNHGNYTSNSLFSPHLFSPFAPFASSLTAPSYSTLLPNEEVQDDCWLSPTDCTWIELIVNVPNLMVLSMNFFFLIVVLREICIKASATPVCASTQSSLQANRNLLRATTSPEKVAITRVSFVASLRAAILLLPLYGLQYLAMVYRPTIRVCWLALVYRYLTITLDGLQGVLVSLLFCFLNNEVRAYLRRSFFGRRDPQNINFTEIIPASH